MQKSQTSPGFQCTFGDLAAEQQCGLCTTAGGTAWLVLAAFLPLAALLTLGYGVILLALLQTLQVIDLPALTVSAGFAGLPSTQLLGIAVLLGLSERFLNRIGAQAEEVVGTPASHPPTPARPASSRPPRSPPPWRPLPPTPTATSHRRATRPPAPRRNHSQPCRWNSRPRRRGACAGPTPPRSISRGGAAAVKSGETCRRRPRGDGDASHRQPFNQRQSFAIQDLRDATPGPGPTLASDSPARLTEPRARPREPTRTHARGRCRTRAGAAGWR